LTFAGNVPNVCETLIENSVRQSLENFNDWINSNRNIPPLMRKVKVVAEKSFGFSEFEKRDTILWCPNEYKLRWSDFQGKNQESDFSAQSNCMFIFSARPEMGRDTMFLYLQLSACFARKTSWVKTGITSDSLLAHEQLHFDICELYIRKLRKRLMEMDLDPMQYQKQIQPVFNEVWMEYQQSQALYDEQSQHGLISSEQNRWKNEVVLQLSTLSSYSVSSCD
jgi:hypothetical protein